MANYQSEIKKISLIMNLVKQKFAKFKDILYFYYRILSEERGRNRLHIDHIVLYYVDWLEVILIEIIIYRHE